MASIITLSAMRWGFVRGCIHHGIHRITCNWRDEVCCGTENENPLISKSSFSKNLAFIKSRAVLQLIWVFQRNTDFVLLLLAVRKKTVTAFSASVGWSGELAVRHRSGGFNEKPIMWFANFRRITLSTKGACAKIILLRGCAQNRSLFFFVKVRTTLCFLCRIYGLWFSSSRMPYQLRVLGGNTRRRFLDSVGIDEMLWLTARSRAKLWISRRHWQTLGMETVWVVSRVLNYKTVSCPLRGSTVTEI